MIYIATISDLMIRISANSSGLRRELENSRRQMRRAFGPEAMAASSATADAAGQVMGALAIAMGGVGIASVKMAAGMEQNKIAFETMLGSAQAANNFLQNLQTFAERTPFTFDGLITGSKRMLAMGFSAEEIIPTLTSVGDAVAAIGGTSETLDRVTLAFSQMKAKGIVSTQEINQLAEAGIPAFEMLAKAIGVDVPTAMKMVENRAVSANTAISGMLSQMSTKYGGMMEKQSQTITGLMSNIQDKVSATMRKVGEDIVVAFDLKAVTSSALATLEEFSSQTRQLGIGKAMIEMVPASVEISILAVSGALIGRMVPALYEARLAVWAVTASLGPYMIVGAAITTMLGVLAYKSTKAGAETTAMNNAIYDGVGRMGSAGDSANGLSNSLIGVGNAASYAAQQMNILNGMADFKRSEDTNDLPSDYWSKRNAKPVPPPVTPFTMPENSGGSGGGGSNAIDDAAKAFEDLQKTAKATSDSIKDEWISLTGTQIDALNNWRDKEQADLDASASANADYAIDKGRLDEIYAEKKKKIEADQLRNSTDIWADAAKNARDLQAAISTAGIEGPQKEMLDMQNEYNDALAETEEKYKKLSAAFAGMDKDSQAQYLLANSDVTKNDDGSLNYAKRIFAEKAILAKNYELAVGNYHKDEKEYEYNLNKAYSDGNISAYAAELSSKQALLSQDLAGRQELMDSYYTIWQDSHRTAMSYMAEGISTMYGGLTTFFTDVFNGTSSIGDAWNALGSTVGNMLAGMAAQWIASRIAMWAVEKLFGGKQQAMAVTQGTATAAAWAPAAAMVSLATMGANAVPAMAGMALTTGVAFGLASIPALANGGITTGPALAQIGEGKYQEAVLPLNKKVFEKMGLTGGDDGEGSKHLTINVSTMDSKSFRQYLNASGGAEIQRFFGKQAGAFAIQGG